jgi:hypothetical protein
VSKRFLAVFFVILISVTLVGSVSARPRVSGRFSVGSLHVEGDATDLRGVSSNGVTIVLETTLNGVALCQGHYGTGSTMRGNSNNNNNNLVRGDTIEGVAISRTLFIPHDDIHRGRRAEFQMDIDDHEINDAIFDLLGEHPDVCPHETQLVKLEIRTLTPNLVLIQGEFSSGLTTLGEEHDDNHILDEVTYDCRVNYRRHPNPDGTRTARCHVVKHESH